MRPCGKATESTTHVVGERKINKEERDVLDKMKKTDERDMEKVWYTEKVTRKRSLS